MINTQLAHSVIEQLLAAGVQEICMCPSSRNAPLVATLAANPKLMKVYYFFEERSASFFALGRIRSTGLPVAVSTTSGSAAGELLPATMEAYYAGLPLILVTADRPRRYRGTGAPQTAEQVGLFGVYVSQSVDLAGTEKLDIASSILDRPFHLNVCFEEPLLESESEANNPYLFHRSRVSISSSSSISKRLGTSQLESNAQQQIRSFLEHVRRPLIIVSGLQPGERESVVTLLERWGAPAYLESLSGLREDPRLNSIRVHSPDRLMERAIQGDYPIDGIVRIGGMPTLRFWRDLEGKYSQMNVLSLSRLSFSGLGRPSSLVTGPLEQVCSAVLEEKFDRSILPSSFRYFLELDHQATLGKYRLLEEEPTSEPGMIAALSNRIPRKSRIYLGNSMPIREWDLAASLASRGHEVWASRGVNGIDGQISSFLGFSSQEAENWGIFGDLTTLYDLPGPWILPQLKDSSIQIAVVNNQGGRIFSRLFPHEEFQNRHSISFAGWAEMWGMKYEKWSRVPGALPSKRDHRMIELLPDDLATTRFWKKYGDL